MPATLKEQHGYSLPEVLISVVLLVLVITALAGYQRSLASSAYQLTQYRLLWRNAWNGAGLLHYSLPAGWQISRVETSEQRCVSITVTIIAPTGRRGQLTRLHCPGSGG